MSDFPISLTEFRRPAPGEPKVVAVYCFRYDAELVPDLIENIRPFVHAAVALDDRDATAAQTEEPPRRAALHAAARAAGADWILAADPDERFEPALARLMPVLTAPSDRPVLWLFNLRELFAMDSWRTDGVWGDKSKVVLYPAAATLQPTEAAQHGAWIRHDPAWNYVHSGLNIYHLRHISPRRTDHRRRTWAAVDPDRIFQAIGYDYLSDLRDAQFAPIPPDRMFRPDRPPDDGLWAVEDTARIGPVAPDPLDCRLNRIMAFRRRAGAAQAAHVAADLAAERPGDGDLRLLAAALHLRGQNPAAALAALPPETADDPFFARLLRGRAHLALGDTTAARAAAADMPTALTRALLADATRDRADFTAPDAQWRGLVPAGETAIAEGARNGRGPLCAIVITHRGGPSPRAAVAAVADQSDATEIVLVGSGDATLPDLGPLNDRIRRIAVAAPLYVGAARNIGLLASRGDILAFIAGDCIVAPGWTEARLARHATGALSVSSAVLPERPATLTGRLAARHTYPGRDPWLTADLTNHSGRSYTRALHAEVGLFAPGLRIGEDTELNIRADTVGRPLWAPEIVVRHGDPHHLPALLADMRRRAAQGITSAPPPEGQPPDWIDRAMVVRLARLRRFSADDPLGPPGPVLRWLDRLALRAFRLGLHDRDKVLRAAAAYRAGTACLAEDPAAAARHFAEAAAVAPQVAAYHAARGRAHRAAGDHLSAITAFEAALALSPGDGHVLQALIQSLSDLGRHAEAHARAEAQTLLAPDSYHVARAAANAAIGCGHLQIALFHAHRALAIDPTRPDGHRVLARLHGRLGNADQAEQRNRMAQEIEAAIARRTAARGG